MEIGNSLRSIDECLELASTQDSTILSSMMDLRAITGDSNLCINLKNNLNKKLLPNISQNFINEKDLDLYDVLLPLSTHYETSGSYINIEGKSQSFDKACDNLYDSKEGWKILTYLANNLDLNNFNYEDISDVQEEINSIIRKNLYFEFNFDSDLVIKKSLSPTNSIRYGNFHHYFTNAMLRRASSLLQYKKRCCGLCLTTKDSRSSARDSTSLY